MTYCPTCGAQCPDGARFCNACGAAMAAEQPTVNSEQTLTPPAPVYRNPFDPPSQQPIQQPYQATYQQPYQAAPYRPVYTAPSAAEPTPLTRAIKESGASPLFLGATATYALGLLMVVVGAFSADSLIERVLKLFGRYIPDWDTVMEEMQTDLPYDFFNMLKFQTGFSVLFAMIPLALVCAGMFMFYRSARNENEAIPKSTGLSLINGVAIYRLVGVGGGAVAIVIMLGFGVLALFAVQEATVAMVLAASSLFLAASIALSIAFYASAIRSLSSVKKTLADGRSAPVISRFLTGMIIYTAISTLVQSIPGFIFFGIPLGLANFLQGAGMALLAAVLVQFRKKIQELQDAPPCTEPALPLADSVAPAQEDPSL